MASMYSVFLDSGRWLEINTQSRKFKWNNLLQYTLAIHGLSAAGKGQRWGQVSQCVFLNIILILDEVKALSIQKVKNGIKINKLASQKLWVQSFHTSLFMNSSGCKNFNREPRFCFLLFFTPSKTHYAKTKMPDVSNKHCTTYSTCQTLV